MIHDPWKHQRDRERQARQEAGHTRVDATVARGLVAAFLAVVVSVSLVQWLFDDPQRAGVPEAVRREEPPASGHAHGGTAGQAPDAAVVDPAEHLDDAARSPVTGERSPCDLAAALADAAGAYQGAEAVLFWRVVAANRAILRQLTACEDRLEDDSVVGRAIRPPIQSVLTRVLGAGNEQAYVGRDGWLFYRPDVDYVTGPGFLEPDRLEARRLGGDAFVAPPQPDPRPAIIDFHRQLAARGIALVVMPTPVKPSIHPDRLAGPDRDEATIVQNASFETFVDDLERAGVLVFDPAPLLARIAATEPDRNGPPPAYLATDTHWRPETMERVADALAAHLERHVDLANGSPETYARIPEPVTNAGDVLGMLELSPTGAYPAERVTIRRVVSPGMVPPPPDSGSDVLLLGDSFSNIYSLGVMGWGTAAGLGEHLSFALRRHVDRIVRNDAGAYATRQALASELGRGRDRLARTRVVVYQFATRELAFGDWRLIELPESPPASTSGGLGASGSFLALEAGRARIVTGTIAAASVVPRPGTVPYRDHIRSLHVTGLAPADAAGPVDATEMLAYVWSMRDNVWTDAASLGPGDAVTLRVRSWDDVASEYDGVNRSELPNDRLLLVEPVWGEAVEP